MLPEASPYPGNMYPTSTVRRRSRYSTAGLNNVSNELLRPHTAHAAAH